VGRWGPHCVPFFLVWAFKRDLTASEHFLRIERAPLQGSRTGLLRCIYKFLKLSSERSTLGMALREAVVMFFV